MKQLAIAVLMEADMRGKVFISDVAVDQHRVPKCKKRRVRKKWRKNPLNFRPMRSRVIALPGGSYVVSRHMACTLRRARLELERTQLNLVGEGPDGRPMITMDALRGL